jgi:flavoprotein hydroxylase
VAIDVDGTYLAYLGAAGAVAALIRPDHYLFGTATTLADLPALISDLRRQLAADPAVPATDPAVSSLARS